LRTQKAFILIKAQSGYEKAVAENLIKLPEATEVHIVPGEWDILLVIETEREIALPTNEKVLNFVMEKVSKMSHVMDTSTLLPSFSKFKS